MNCYADLKSFKSYFQLTETTYDADLLDKLIDGSRDVDKDTGRFFYSWEGTRYFSTGKNQSILRLPIDDLQSFSSIAVDLTGSGTYVTLDLTKTPPDAFLLDENGETNLLPYIYIEANPNGGYSAWGESVRRALRITGVFGYGNDFPKAAYVLLGDTVQDDPMTAVQLTLKVASAALVSLGQTLRIESEQVFISSFDTGTMTAVIIRGVNGTTAAAHIKTTPLYVYRYPQAITHAVMVYAAREWRRRQSAYANRIENVILGTVEVYKGSDPSYLDEVKRYKRLRFWRNW